MIELMNVSGGYHSQNTVLNVSLSLPKGQITGIVGRNGSGKSTLLKLMCGQLEKNSGEITLDGQALGTIHRRQIAQKISYLPQWRNVPDITVESLVLHGRFPWLRYPRVYRESDYALAQDAMKQANVFAHRDKQLSALSGGERQNVYIAMMLAQDTETLLLDEPTTYLDIAHQLDLMDLLKELARQGKAIAIVIHDLSVALEQADTIAVMQDGQLLRATTSQATLESQVLEKAFGVKATLKTRTSFERLN
jgi:iron complex transport system ATP-binding protein